MELEQEIPADAIDSGPRKRRPIRGAGTKAHRRSLVLDALRATLAQETIAGTEARPLRPVVVALVALAGVSGRRRGRYRSVELDEAIDDVLRELGRARADMDRIAGRWPPPVVPYAPRPDPLDVWGLRPLAQQAPDAVH